MTLLLSNGLPTSIAEVTPGFSMAPRVFSDPSDTYKAMAYEAIYRRQPAVFSVVNRLLYGMSRLPLKAYQFGEDGESRQHVRSGDLPTLVRQPWPRHSRRDLIAALGFDLLVNGKCLAWNFRGRAGMTPDQVWPVPWSCVQPYSDARGIYNFHITIGGTIYVVDPRDVVYLELLGGGVSPLEPLRRTIGLEEDAIKWQSEAMHNSFSAKAIYTTKANVTNEPVMKALRAGLDDLYRGPSGKQYAIFGEGSDVKPLTGMSAVDLDLIKQKQSSIEAICACYDTQPAVLGFSTTGQATTYASAREWRQSFYVDGIGPKVDLIESGLNSQLVFPEAAWSGMFLEFDLSALLSPDSESQARAAMLSMQSASSTINQRLRDRNEPPIDHPLADTIFVPANMIPLEQYDQTLAADIAATPAALAAKTAADKLVSDALTAKE